MAIYCRPGRKSGECWISGSFSHAGEPIKMGVMGNNRQVAQVRKWRRLKLIEAPISQALAFREAAFPITCTILARLSDRQGLDRNSSPTQRAWG